MQRGGRGRRRLAVGCTGAVLAALAVPIGVGPAAAAPAVARPAPPAATAPAVTTGEDALPAPGLPALPRGTAATDAAPEAGARPEVVIGADDRQQVNHPRSSPHGAIGQLYASFGGRSAPCTGFLVYKDTVATAAHCLYDSDTNRKASYVSFRPGVMPTATGGFFECHTTNPENIRVPQSYIDSPRLGNDLGVIKVYCSDGVTDRVNVLDYTGWFGFSQVDETDELVRLAGYPAEVRDQPVEDTMFFDTGFVRSTRPNVLKYDMDASSGQSGAPVFDRLSTPVRGWYVLAVHGGGGRDLPDPRLRNWGARTAGANYQLLYNWCLRPVRPG